jgi:uncharacterized membrane protein
MLIEFASEPAMIFYLISLGGGLISLCLTIKKTPPESYKTALPFFLSLPLVPFIALASYPLTIHISLRDAWKNKIRQESLTVRKR